MVLSSLAYARFRSEIDAREYPNKTYGDGLFSLGMDLDSSTAKRAAHGRWCDVCVLAAW